MLRKVGLTLILCLIPFGKGNGITSINTEVVNKSIVFFYAADASGKVMPAQLVATGFLIGVPKKNTSLGYRIIVTARHVVDPVWAGCGGINPQRLYVRVNTKQYDPQKDDTGVAYLPLDLIKDGMEQWAKSDDDAADAAILPVPGDIGDYDVQAISFREFARPEEAAKLGPGSQIASNGLVPGLAGQKRNYPVFKFGKIASIPDELIPSQCGPGTPARNLKVWVLGANLVPGNSGSPIYFDPLVPPGGIITTGEPRAMIIGLQSLSFIGADLAGMTPAKYIVELISKTLPPDADLTLGPPPQ